MPGEENYTEQKQLYPSFHEMHNVNLRLKESNVQDINEVEDKMDK